MPSIFILDLTISYLIPSFTSSLLVFIFFKNELNSSSLYFSIRPVILGLLYLILSKVYSKSIVLYIVASLYEK